MRAAELQEGQVYGFRTSSRSRKPFERVRLMDALPVRGRVGIRFESGDRKGEEGTLPLAQLIVPWSEAGLLEEEEASYDALASRVSERERTNAEAVEFLFMLYAAQGMTDVVPGGVVFAPEQLEELCDLVDFDPERLTKQELSFKTLRDAWVVPMGVAEELARKLLERDPDEVLEAIVEWEDSPYVPATYRRGFRTIRRWAKVPAAPSKEEVSETHDIRRATLYAIKRLEALAQEAEEIAKDLREKIGL